jgi:hypothetical protein
MPSALASILPQEAKDAPTFQQKEIYAPEKSLNAHTVESERTALTPEEALFV